MPLGECLDQELRDHRTVSLRASPEVMSAKGKPGALGDRLLTVWGLVPQEEEGWCHERT